MDENNVSEMAKPLHIQRMEALLDMGPFMQYAQAELAQPLTSSEDEDDYKVNSYRNGKINKMFSSKKDRITDKRYHYNLSSISADRLWLENLLLSDSDTESDISDEDEYVREMLKDHLLEKKYRSKYYNKSGGNSQYGYYGAGLLSNYDMFPEHQASVIGLKRKKIKKERKPEKSKAMKLKKQSILDELEYGDIDWDEQILAMKEEGDLDIDSKPQSPTMQLSGRGRKPKKILASKIPEMMAMRRRKLWQLMAKKELGKVQRAKVNNHKEMITNCKKVATLCMKATRQKAMQSQKIMKETVWRAKRLTREMQGYWKRYDRVERETRRRMEKEAEEQRKMDVEIIEAKRQQRKLNFLITQTELYAHFMSKKIGTVTKEEQMKILNQLDEETNPRLAAIDDYDSELMKQKAAKNAAEAFNNERARTELFDRMVHQHNPSFHRAEGSGTITELPQPALFKGRLKGYQLKGMTWLANLYDQGISGILADEMGLGKTVQSIAFLCHIAECYGVWGPFLIISPASTLHNWQQEMQRFVPEFNVVPYWGSPNERKILRQFWEQKDLHTKDASFHVVITSYQLVVSDYKYFNRIKWQYMVLDEAQAIKSSSSVRWKLLLGFNCRNRLLLSGTPIQNSMAELWALLHFIMPTLFDSHEEFNEWFSKDIESHAENKTGIDEKQISRLHMILKPFMLRRIKKDVENELSDKIEIMVYCPLTTRQKLLYVALKKKIRIEDLLSLTGAEGHSIDKNFTSNLMNLVMQFRKVCNHPELFERRDARSPLFLKCLDYTIPRLVFDEALINRMLPSKQHLLYNKFSIFKAQNVHRSLFPNPSKVENFRCCFDDINVSDTFSFARYSGLSNNEIERLALEGLIYFLYHICELYTKMKLLHYQKIWQWDRSYITTQYLLLEPSIDQPLNPIYMTKDSVLQPLLFTAMVTKDSSVYCHTEMKIVSTVETMEHRIIRSKNKWKAENGIKTNELFTKPDQPESHIDSITILPEFHHIPRTPQKFSLHPMKMPAFVYGLPSKVITSGRKLYCESRAATWWLRKHEECENVDGLHLVRTGIEESYPNLGWSNITIPDKQTLVSDAGKLAVLDSLLTRLKSQGHRVLIYSQMTKMIDLLEEYMWHRKHRYMRLDGSSKISARRDMVADFQNRADIFVFLLSTRAGGLGINLTAADTVIFYDSDWNPTVDQQAMDRAHRLGQTKQVTVYRLICKGTIEERILQRAREKSEIQRMVISGGNFKPDTLKPKEVVSLLLDDEEIELKYRQKTEERKCIEDQFKSDKDRDRKRKQHNILLNKVIDQKRIRTDGVLDADDIAFLDSTAPSPALSEQSNMSSKITTEVNEDSSNDGMIIDVDSPTSSTNLVSFSTYDGLTKARRRHHPRGTKRGRPRGSRRGGGTGALGRSDTANADGSSDTVPQVPQIKRGPGRPRLKPPGPSNQGYRNIPRPKKRVGPLVVPLASPVSTPVAQSPAQSPKHQRSFGFYNKDQEEDS